MCMYDMYVYLYMRTSFSVQLERTCIQTYIHMRT